MDLFKAHSVRLIGAVVLIVMAAVAVDRALADDGQEAADDGEPVAFHYHFDEKRPLTVGTSRLLYLDATDYQKAEGYLLKKAEWLEAARAGPSFDWADVGIRQGEVSPDDHFRMWSLDVSDRGLDQEGIVELVEQIAARPNTHFVSPVFRTERGGKMFLKPSILFRPEVGVTEQELRAILTDLGFDVDTLVNLHDSGLPRHYRVRAASSSGLQHLLDVARLNEHPLMNFAQSGLWITGQTGRIPNDSGFGLQWGLLNTGQTGGVAGVDIDATTAWDETLGQGVLVLVLDDGVELDHPDLNIDPIASADFEDAAGDGGPRTPNDNHGTTVAGVIASQIDGIGTVGAAPGAFVASARV